MAEWNKVKDDSGVFGGKFELSSEPVLGDWKITCAINTVSLTKVKINTLHLN